MRTYSYQTTGASVSDQIAYRNAMMERQNNLANGTLSGGTTVPQFATSGAPVGINHNTTIQNMANLQSKLDASNAYSTCSGKSAASCGGRRLRSRRSRRRQKKMKSKKKYHKI